MQELILLEKNNFTNQNQQGRVPLEERFLPELDQTENLNALFLI